MTKADKQKRYQASLRIKKAPLNLAAEGARLDIDGVRYVGEKGTKRFLRDRKRNIVNINRQQFHSVDDQVKIDPEDYIKYQEEQLNEDIDFELPEID